MPLRSNWQLRQDSKEGLDRSAAAVAVRRLSFGQLFAKVGHSQLRLNGL